jgi:hypothetical protein
MNIGKKMADIERIALNEPTGWLDELKKVGTVNGERIFLTEAQAEKFYGVEYVKHLREKVPSRPASTPKNPVAEIKEGVGTELKKLFASIGIQPIANCSCNARARQMNEKGIAWCEENIDLIVSWLKEEHTKQKSKIPFIEMAVKMVVKLAISNAKKNL